MAVMRGGREAEGKGLRGAATSTERPAKVTPPGNDSISHPLHTGLLSPADKVVLAYILLMSSLVVIFRHRVDLWRELLVGHALIIGLVVLIAYWWRKRSASD